jgi:hypothetical protein
MYGAFDPYLTALERWRRLDANAQDSLVGARLLRKLLYALASGGRFRAESRGTDGYGRRGTTIGGPRG